MLIRVTIDQTEPLSGTAAGDEGSPLPFLGWLELLRVISDLVEAAARQDRPDRGDE